MYIDLFGELAKMTADPSKKQAFQNTILKWYRIHGRSFSWRTKRSNAYHILIAELMLRKTDTQKVQEVFNPFIVRYPDINSLAEAKETDLRYMLYRLGIADRARLFRQLAAQIRDEHSGKIPREYKILIKLPGVGPYTANAMLCFAFNIDAPLLDTNIIRILSRVFSIQSTKTRPRNDPYLWEIAEDLQPKGRSSSFNRALLDFGALACTNYAPSCRVCPLSGMCDYYCAKSDPNC